MSTEPRKTDSQLRDEFDAYFKKIKETGELEKLQNYYFKDMGWMKKE